MTVDGPNDLSACPLERVCFEITHTWVGDLSVSLTAPSGLTYLVMADIDNDTLGCGNEMDNINVCITLGTGNPLTNNTEYVCNGGLGLCLTGDWTVPCGGVTDPITNAPQAPNCDLNDFNLPGEPANGLWTLTVNDICPFDVGFLETWSLEFACGTLDCTYCPAEGGGLGVTEVLGCEGSSDLILSLPPDQGPNPPDTTLFGYAYLIVQNDTILTVDTLADLSTYPPGDYQVCGLSYDLVEADSLLNLPGIALPDLSLYLPECSDLSDSCVAVSVFAIPAITQIDTTLCFGECFDAPDGTSCCSPGLCTYTLPSYQGCDSVVQVTVTILPENTTALDFTVCPGECVAVGGMDFCGSGNYSTVLPDVNGCDSTITITLTEVPVAAVVALPDTISCDNPLVVLDGSTSLGSTFQWTDENGLVLSNTPTVQVGQAGCYSLLVSETLNGVSCDSSLTVCVEDVSALPTNPVFLNSPTAACQGDTVLYSIAADPEATGYNWTLPSGAVLLSGGDGSTFAEVLWNGGGLLSVCVAGTNGCGAGPQDCVDVSVTSLVVEPEPNGPLEVCPGVLATYCTPVDPNASDYQWIVPSSATIVSGQGTECIEVDWTGSNGGVVCIATTGACNVSEQVCFPVTVLQPVFTPAIAGPSEACVTDTLTYSISPPPNAIDYVWQVPAGATILSGNGQASVSVVFSNPLSGDLCVQAVNACGEGTISCVTVDVFSQPAITAITGPATACQLTAETYCVLPDPNTATFNWTVPAGALILSGQGSPCIDVLWNGAMGGNLCVQALNACGNSPSACLPVAVTPAPDLPTLQGPTEACLGDTLEYTTDDLPWIDDYTWSLPAGAQLIAGGNGMPFVLVLWTQAGPFDLCLFTANDCGLSQQPCLQVNVADEPMLPQISGMDTVCVGTITTLCTPPDLNAQDFTWTLPAGAQIIGGQGTNCIDVEWLAPGSGDLCVSASGNCGLAVSSCQTITALDVPLDPLLSGPQQLCAGEQALYVAQSSMATSYDWSVPACLQVISGLGTDSLLVVALSDCPAESVCVTASNLCGQSASVCLSLEVFAAPFANAGPDDAICGQAYFLDAQASVGMGSWTLAGAAGNVLFADPNDPHTAISVDAFGAYQFVWQEINGICTDADSVTISFFEPLLASEVEESCDYVNGEYTVSVTVTSGDPPFVVDGLAGVFTGNTFVSDPIPAGTPYQFGLVNAWCDTLSYSGLNVCACLTEAGETDPNLLEACLGATVTAIQTVPPGLEPGDSIIYVLHDSPDTLLGNIFATSLQPTFGLAPGMFTGQPYYISAVAGDWLDNTGTVNLNDPCLAVAAGTPVIFHSLPSGNLFPPPVVCEGQATELIVDLAGNGPFELLLNDSLYTGVQELDTLIFFPEPGTGLVWSTIFDANGCSTVVEDTLNIMVNEPPFAVVVPAVSVCNTPLSGDSTQIVLADLLLGGDLGGEWEDTDGLGLNLLFPFVDFALVDTGTYTLTYTTNSAQLPCAEASYPVLVTVEACNCAGQAVVAVDTACNQGSAVNMNNWLNSPIPGTWQIAGAPPNATNLPVISGNLLQPAGADPGDYSLLFIPADTALVSGCPDTAQVGLFLQEAPVAALNPTASLEACTGDDLVFQLGLALGIQPGGVWEETSASSCNCFDPQTGAFATVGVSPGTYFFEYSLAGVPPCEADVATATVTIFPLPNVVAEGADLVLSCQENFVQLGGSGTSIGARYQPQWEVLDGGPLTQPNIYFPVVSNPGTYALTITDTITGCFASDTVTIDRVEPVSEVDYTLIPVSCVGDDGVIQVDNAQGDSPPFEYSLDGTNFQEEPFFEFLGPGDYTLYVRDSLGCLTEFPFFLEEPDPVAIDLFASGFGADETISVILGQEVELEAITPVPEINIDALVWDPAELAPSGCLNCLTANLQALENLVVTVSLTSGPCMVSDSIEIKIVEREGIKQPNIFSPNGDNNNDKFTLYFGPEVVRIVFLQIYTRWGERVFNGQNLPPNDPELGWDGSFRGKPLNPAVFAWVAKVEKLDGSTEIFYGDVLLVR